MGVWRQWEEGGLVHQLVGPVLGRQGSDGSRELGFDSGEEA